MKENHRDILDQLRSLGFVDAKNHPTVVGMLVCGKDPRACLPGAYVQFVRYPGREIGEVVVDQKEISGALSEVFRRVDDLVTTNISDEVDLSGGQEDRKPNYPRLALQELIRNAIIHRDYEVTTAPVMLSWYADRVEITSPGGPYGAVTVESFGVTGLTDARNPAIASAAKAMGFVQRFGSGIPRAQAALRANGNSPAEFNVEQSFVNVIVRAAT